MDYKEKILLGSKKNVVSINNDAFSKIKLENKTALTTEHNLNRIINASDVFDLEREEGEKYRIYGVVEYFSLLNRVEKDYSRLSDFFIKKTPPILGDVKTILNTFKIYLLKPFDEPGDEYSYGGHDNLYLRKYEVIATPKHLNITEAGFSVNLFNEEKYYFDFNVDFDVSSWRNPFGFPITELFLYFEYQKDVSIDYPEEVFYKFEEDYYELYEKDWDVGDILYDSDKEQPICSVVKYKKDQYLEEEIYKQNFKIKTLTEEGGIYWEYNPFIPIKLRYLSGSINRGNENNTSYEQKYSIPKHATKIDNNGNYIWRDILPDGTYDLLTNEGVDHPFVNKRKYVFNKIILSIEPDLSHENTNNQFSEILFGEHGIITNKPNNPNINNIGKPCL